jgi:hypothetical protein
MALLCAKHIASYPPALQVRLLEQSKALAKKFMSLDREQQEKLQPEMIELMQTIKECDKDRAIQFTNLAKGLSGNCWELVVF